MKISIEFNKYQKLLIFVVILWVVSFYLLSIYYERQIASERKIKGGVKVDAAEGVAARAGLREGDVIMSVANVEINTVKDFEAALAKADKTKAINVLFRRGEWAQYALIRAAR